MRSTIKTNRNGVPRHRPYSGRSPVLGTLHPSGLNRHERRANAAIKRHTSEDARKERAQDHRDLQKWQRELATKRRADAAHTRAIERRQAAAGTTPMLTRARKAMQAMLSRKVEAKKARHARYTAKHAVV